MIVTVLIPAHNEAERIARTVTAAQAIEGVTQVIVIDDGSADATAAAAESAGAKVIRLARNVGKGAALNVGAKRAEDADVVLLLDADLAEAATQAALLLDPVLRGEADLSIAAFPRPAGKAGFGLVKGLARWGISHLGGEFDATAPLSGQRALNRRALNAVLPFSAGFGVEVGMTVHALRAGLRLVEVPTTMTHSATGRDLAGFVHRGRQFAHVALALLKLTLERPGVHRS